MDFDNLNSEKNFNPGSVYFNSKMANVMTANHLAKQLSGTGEYTTNMCFLSPSTIHKSIDCNSSEQNAMESL